MAAAQVVSAVPVTSYSTSAPVQVQGVLMPQPAAQSLELEPVPVQTSISDQIAQLAALHKQGVLSDSEFEAAKARVLQVQRF